MLMCYVCRRHLDKEGGRWVPEDQGVLGLDPRGGGAGEVLGAQRPLQAHLHGHAVAADAQGGLRHHEPRRQPHPTGTKPTNNYSVQTQLKLP